MRVLIADFDLFKTVGGGQTFYRSIIQKNPGIQFFYLSRHEPLDAPRPTNAQPIPFREHYSAADFPKFSDAVPLWAMYVAVRANNIAHTVSGLKFDVVDFPDYEQFGLFLHPAFARHQVEVGRVALSMHGRISTSIELNWATEGECNQELVAQEDMQFQAVDLRYGLSLSYLDEWRDKFDLASHYLSPLRFIERPTPKTVRVSSKSPDLLFVGRTEKRKGPDLFVDLAWWLPRDSFRDAKIIGPESYDPNGKGSGLYLYTMANNRLGVDQVELLPTATPKQLDALFATRVLAMVPSRYDTFNLVAIESLLSGCPTAIGNGAGVCRFLEETFPDVPFIKIDIDNAYGAIPELIQTLDDYDAYRQGLVASLRDSRPEVEGPDLREIYSSARAFDSSVRSELDDWYRRLMAHELTPFQRKCVKLRSKSRDTMRQATPAVLRRGVRAMHPRQLLRNGAATLKATLQSTRLAEQLKNRQLLAQAKQMAGRYRQIHLAPERSDAQIESKLNMCADLVSSLRIDRVRLWREMGRLETLRGNDLVAATYQLRAMRLAGGDRFHDLPKATATLARYGYEREADAADAMYAGHADSNARCANLMDRAYAVNQRANVGDFDYVDDRRDDQKRRVSVIVSLYDAADKLPMFLRALNLQTMFQTQQAELVLIDSGSPTDERRVFEQFASDWGAGIVYARTAKRESIQTAWNRGISLARGKYLSFLGVDEGIVPPALETLANELDADPSLDWVQANSLVTNVNERGHWRNDIMIYDRTGYRPAYVYLETCYLSWVGALYRRDIHDRFGMYDGTFRAAGDTEFKNRVLPFLNTKAIPETLGIFWNYPSGQTTCSPRAELEDLRAWYLHRTCAGIRRAVQAADATEVEDWVVAALKYRKSYCSHWSTDVEFAVNASTVLKERFPNSPVSKLHDGLAGLLSAYRTADCLPSISPLVLREALQQMTLLAERTAAHHGQIAGARVQPAYRVFNDNRHEQHNQIWRAAA
ncbi:MAG: glycosyltransferase [Planctomycetia bacterium]|nr:glycosyltransferase [Planctomycetia bacterium]